MRFTSSLRRRVLAVLAVLGVVGLSAACTRTPETPAARPATPPASASAASQPVAPTPSTSAAATPDPPAPAVPVRSAWTDADSVAALAKDCHWAPATPAGGYDPLQCTVVPDQSCVPNACFETNENECRPACKKTCDGCSGKCVKGCDSCKSKCTDEACRLACATSCGGCRQACLVELDHCDSGKCNDAFAACSTKVEEEWQKSRFVKLCDKRVACVEACIAKASKDDPSGALQGCNMGCAKSTMPGLPNKLLTKCGWL
jgi:hypothetical protein